jgi:hypothetical protein
MARDTLGRGCVNFGKWIFRIGDLIICKVGTLVP